MAFESEDKLTEEVIARIKADSPRNQVILEKLVSHMHAFIKDVEPTEEEWFKAIDFLTRTGQTCTDKRQEFILFSDVLGASMLVDAINNRSDGDATESTVTGPFHTIAHEYPMGTNIARGEELKTGEPTLVRGRIFDEGNQPIGNAVIDVWQSNDTGYYDIQDVNQPEMNLRGVFKTGPSGEFWFRTIKPSAYPVPTDGPVGELLRASGRHPMRPAHIHFMIKAEGFKQLITHVFVKGDDYLESDAVFGVKDSLILEFKENSSEADAQKWELPSPFCEVVYDFKLRRL